jgi:hypothetical protein
MAEMQLHTVAPVGPKGKRVGVKSRRWLAVREGKKHGQDSR